MAIVEHDKYGFTKVSNTLKDAIEAMISHLEYEEPDYDSEGSTGKSRKRRGNPAKFKSIGMFVAQFRLCSHVFIFIPMRRP